MHKHGPNVLPATKAIRNQSTEQVATGQVNYRREIASDHICIQAVVRAYSVPVVSKWQDHQRWVSALAIQNFILGQYHAVRCGDNMCIQPPLRVCNNSRCPSRRECPYRGEHYLGYRSSRAVHRFRKPQQVVGEIENTLDNIPVIGIAR